MKDSVQRLSEEAEALSGTVDTLADKVGELAQQVVIERHKRRTAVRLGLSAAIFSLISMIVLIWLAMQNNDILNRVEDATGPAAQARTQQVLSNLFDTIDQRSEQNIQDLRELLGAALGRPLPPIQFTPTPTTTTTTRPRSSTRSTLTSSAPPPATNTTAGVPPTTSPPASTTTTTTMRPLITIPPLPLVGSRRASTMPVMPTTVAGVLLAMVAAAATYKLLGGWYASQEALSLEGSGQIPVLSQTQDGSQDGERG